MELRFVPINMLVNFLVYAMKYSKNEEHDGILVENLQYP